MEHKKNLTPAADTNTLSKIVITTSSRPKPSPKTKLKRRVSLLLGLPPLLFVTPPLLFVTPPSKESNTSKQEIFERVESLEMGEVVRGDLGKEDVDIDNVETGDRNRKSDRERKWSLTSSFSIGSKSSRSSILSGSSNGSGTSKESSWNIGSSVSLARSSIHGDVECIISDISLHSHFLYWPIPAFFLSIIVLMVVFTVLAVILS